MMGAGIQPRESASDHGDIQIATLKVHSVDIGDFQLTPPRWAKVLSKFHDALVIEVKPGDGKVRFGDSGLFFNGDGASCGIKLHHSVAAWIRNAVRHDGRSAVHA